MHSTQQSYLIVATLQEAEKAAKQAADEVKAKAQEAASATSDKVNKVMDSVVDKLPFLDAYRDKLQPALDFLTDKPYRLYIAMALPAFAFLVFLYTVVVGGNKVRHIVTVSLRHAGALAAVSSCAVQPGCTVCCTQLCLKVYLCTFSDRL